MVIEINSSTTDTTMMYKCCQRGEKNVFNCHESMWQIVIILRINFFDFRWNMKIIWPDGRSYISLTFSINQNYISNNYFNNVYSNSNAFIVVVFLSFLLIIYYSQCFLTSINQSQYNKCNVSCCINTCTKTGKMCFYCHENICHQVKKLNFKQFI